jgi:Flp pilus assembly protein TadG
MVTSRPGGRRRERGQVLVIFALGLVAIVAMVGLVLDGGDTFVRKRDQQNVADQAAMAAGYSYMMNNYSAASASSAAWSTAAANGYTNLANGVSISVTLDAAGSVPRHITVTITKPHRNNFAGVVGLSSWPVTTTATVEAGWANGVVGAMPIIFNLSAFQSHGVGPDNAFTYSEPPSGSQDVPQTPDTFNWTMYCNNCNADSNTVDSLIVAGGVETVVDLSYLITPLNAGSHATLYSDLATYAVGTDFPVPLVDSNGLMVGFVMFHLTGSVGGSTKTISGYFTAEVNPSAMTITNAPVGIGTPIVKLTN